MESWAGFIDLFAVLMFAAAWAILEWAGRRLDQKRVKDAEASAKDQRPSQ